MINSKEYKKIRRLNRTKRGKKSIILMKNNDYYTNPPLKFKDKRRGCSP